MAKDLTFDIEEHLGIISEEKSGYSIQLNKASWSGNPAKIDLRRFNSEGRPLKGIALTEQEATRLKQLLEDNGF